MMEVAEEEEEIELDYINEDAPLILRTHEKINRHLAGEIITFKEGYVELRLTTSAEMVADDMGLIHGGYLFSAADFAAMAAVNERNVVLVASDCQFLSPVKFHDEVNFVARVRHTEGRKRNVYVTGHVLEIKVFEGEFKTVITERHILKLKLTDDEKKA
ncbi:MAG: hotdog domain-containing protein [Campylobacterota bacterium]|nr:hotdog domain-containing protein [Campylobacterota bacterium]